jgi:hypothetical protein
MDMALSLERARQLLVKAPGPAPWYLEKCAPAFESRWGQLTWTHVNGVSVLQDPDGKARLILGIYAFIIGLAPRRLLIWHQPWKGTHDGTAIVGHVDFRVINTDHLDVITDVDQAAAILKKRHLPMIELTPSTESRQPVLSIPIGSGGGAASVGMPDELNGMAELLFFVHVEGTQLWALNPKLRMLEVMPQDWFNNGDFDFGYQWPTRAARDELTRAIVGDGIRIGTFVLDRSGRNISTWLEKTV